MDHTDTWKPSIPLTTTLPDSWHAFPLSPRTTASPSKRPISERAKVKRPTTTTANSKQSLDPTSAAEQLVNTRVLLSREGLCLLPTISPRDVFDWRRKAERYQLSPESITVHFEHCINHLRTNFEFSQQEVREKNVRVREWEELEAVLRP